MCVVPRRSHDSMSRNRLPARCRYGHERGGEQEGRPHGSLVERILKGAVPSLVTFSVAIARSSSFH